MAVVVRETFAKFFAQRKGMPNKLTKKKAKKILEHGEVRGHALTGKQKRLFGLIASGKKPTRLHNPHEPYGDNKEKAKNGETGAYKGKGKMGRLNQ